MRTILRSLPLCLALIGVEPGRARAQGPGEASSPSGPLVMVVPIHGALSEGTIALSVRAVREAERRGAAWLVLDINCPGGRIDWMDRIIQALDSSSVPCVAYVTQEALSASALIALSCERLYMQPGTTIGSALPWIQMPFGLPLPQVDGKPPGGRSEKEEKMIGAFRGRFRAKAQKNGRNEYLAEAMVDPQVVLYEITVNGVRDIVRDQELRELESLHGKDSVRRMRVISDAGNLVNLTSLEADELGFIDGQVPDLEAVQDLLGVPGSRVHRLELSWSEGLASWISTWGWALMVVGLIAVFIEIKVPGFGIPGILGIACLTLVLLGKYMAGLAEVAEVLLIVLGFVLLAVELFLVPGTMVAGILGTLAILLGILLSFQSFHLPNQAPSEWAQEHWWSTSRNLMVALAGSIIGTFAVANLLHRVPFFHRRILRSSAPGSFATAAVVDDVHRGWAPDEGTIAEVVTPLRPAGKILVEGRLMDAVAQGQFVDKGAHVWVVNVEGNRIVVRAHQTGSGA